MRTLFLWIIVVITLGIFVAALHLWVPALNFQLFALGLAALEWAPWFLLALVVCLIVGLSNLQFHPRLAQLIILLSFISGGLIGQRLWATLTTTPQMWSEMPSVTEIPKPGFSLLDFVQTPNPNIQVEADQVYANIDGITVTLDVYRPPTTFQTPSIVVIHGGSWRGGIKSEIPATNRHWAAQGYTVFDINYRLAPEYPFPAAIEDVYCALQFIEDNTERWNIDPKNTVLVGRSAGAQIALVAGYSFDEPTFRTRCNPTQTTIKGVLGYYAPTRLDYYNKIKPSLAPGALDDYLGGPPEAFEDVYEQARPANWVDRQTPPTMLLHGGRDQFVRTIDTWELIQELDETNRPFVGIELPYANHGFDFNPRGPSNQLVQPYVDQFLAVVTNSTEAE